MVVIHRLALATINLSTEFEVSNSTDYKDIKGDSKRTKWGGLEQLRVTPFNRVYTIQVSPSPSFSM